MLYKSAVKEVKLKRLLLALLFLMPLPRLAFAQAVVSNMSLTATYVQVPNAGATGTTLNALAKLTGAPSTAVIMATTDVEGAVGVVVNGFGTSGSATIQKTGTTYLQMDGATTAGDYVTISSTTAGYGHDSGYAPPARPLSGQIIGRVWQTLAGSGIAIVGLDTHPRSLFAWTANGLVAPTTATSLYFYPNGSLTQAAEGAATEQIVPSAAIIMGLECETSAAQGSGISDTFTVRTGAYPGQSMSASTVTTGACTNTQQCTQDTTHTVAVSSGNAVDIQDTSSGTASARTAYCSIELVM